MYFLSILQTQTQPFFFYSINTQKLVTDIPVLILDGVRSSVGTVKSYPD